ncbi:MAG TPA: hypothetical protein VJ694_00065 [Patescibacteria group bacterium]|nr:hypothetical protein [Patescibacteria group bacterium]
MANGTVLAICISPAAGAPMRSVDSVMALAGLGLEGDRYAAGEGSWNKGRPGKSQVTLVNGLFFPGSGFDHLESRRNIVTMGVELMDLIGKEFAVGDAKLRGVRYCDPCQRPSVLAGKSVSFKEAFHDRGGLVAEVLESGLITVGCAIVPPPKKH